MITVVGLVAYLVLGPVVLGIAGSLTPGRPGDFSSFILTHYIHAYCVRMIGHQGYLDDVVDLFSLLPDVRHVAELVDEPL